MPEHTTLLEFKRTKGVVTMRDMEFISNVMRGFYNTDIASKIKGAIFMGHHSNVNTAYEYMKEQMDTILGPGSYFNPEAEANEKIGGKIPNGKF